MTHIKALSENDANIKSPLAGVQELYVDKGTLTWGQGHIGKCLFAMMFNCKKYPVFLDPGSWHLLLKLMFEEA